MKRPQLSRERAARFWGKGLDGIKLTPKKSAPPPKVNKPQKRP